MDLPSRDGQIGMTLGDRWHRRPKRGAPRLVQVFPRSFEARRPRWELTEGWRRGCCIIPSGDLSPAETARRYGREACQRSRLMTHRRVCSSAGSRVLIRRSSSVISMLIPTVAISENNLSWTPSIRNSMERTSAGCAFGRSAMAAATHGRSDNSPSRAFPSHRGACTQPPDRASGKARA